jgi:hypothetical protein
MTTGLNSYFAGLSALDFFYMGTVPFNVVLVGVDGYTAVFGPVTPLGYWQFIAIPWSAFNVTCPICYPGTFFQQITDIQIMPTNSGTIYLDNLTLSM